MEGYMGEEIVLADNTPYADYTTLDWIQYFIESYGGIDGERHKQWVIDVTMRLIHGTPVIIKLAQWQNGHEEYRINLDEPTKAYRDWVQSQIDEYGDYDAGGAP